MYAGATTDRFVVDWRTGDEILSEGEADLMRLAGREEDDALDADEHDGRKRPRRVWLEAVDGCARWSGPRGEAKREVLAILSCEVDRGREVRGGKRCLMR